MSNLNDELVADFEAAASRDTSTESTRHFDDEEEKAAIVAAAKAARK